SSAGLAPGQEYTAEFDITVPVDAEGNWFLIGASDAGQAVKEVGFEANNQAVRPLAVTLAPYADLEISDLTVPAQTIADPARLAVGWTVTNRGTGAGITGSWTDTVLLSRDDVVGNSDDIVLGRFQHSGGLAVGASYRREETLLAPPLLSGRFTLFVQTDSAGVVFENGEEADNRIARTPVDILPRAYADLQFAAASNAPTALSGGSVQVSWRVENRGIGRTDLTQWSDQVWLARKADGTDVAVSGAFDHLGALAAGAGYDRSAALALPEGLSGEFFVFVRTGSPYEFIYGGDNQVLAGKVQVDLAPSADLVVQSITAPADAREGETIQIGWTVLNQGEAAADADIFDTLELFKPGDASARPVSLGSFRYSGGLEAGKFYTRTERVVLPARLEGAWAVRITTNVGARVFELGTRAANNSLLDDQVLQVSTLPRPDVQVATIAAPDTITAGSGFGVSYQIVNRGTVGTSGRWNDKVYLSLDNRFSGDDLLLDTVANPQALDPQGGAYSAATKTVSVPTRYQGQAYILVIADGDNQLDEHPNDANNLAARAIFIDPYPPADLVASAVSAPAQALYGTEIEVRFTVTNDGVNATDKTTWVDSVWLARDATRPTPGLKDDLGQVIGNGGIFLGSAVHVGALAKGESYEAVIKVRIPAQIESGRYFITPWTDAYDAVLEDTFTPNPDDPAEFDSNNYKARAIDILGNPPLPLPDLQVISVTADATGSVDAPFTVSWTVQNRDDGSADNWVDTVYVSDKPWGEAGAKVWSLGTFGRVKPLERLGTYTNTQSFVLGPSVLANYVTVVTDTNAVMPFVVESNETNNAASTTTQIVPRPADLVALSLTADAQSFSGERINVSWTVQNQGQAVWSGTQRWTDEIWLSPDPVMGARAIQLGTVVHDNRNGLAAGATYTESAQFTLPAGIDGPYYLHLVVDGAGREPKGEFESGDNNRTRGAYASMAYEGGRGSNNIDDTTLTVVYREADLVVSQFEFLPTATSGDTVEVRFSVRNQGTRDTRETVWANRVFLSRDPSLDSSDLQVADTLTNLYFNGLRAGESLSYTLRVQIPEGTEGDWYLIGYADADVVGIGGTGPAPTEAGNTAGLSADAVREFRGEGNNVVVKPLAVSLRPAADLQVSEVIIPERVLTGQMLDLRYTVVNAGSGATPPAQRKWFDRVYLSADAALDISADREIARIEHDGALAAGAEYTVSQSIRLRNDLVGPFYVFVLADGDERNPRGQLYEGNREDNNATPSKQPLLIERPPPADLVVTDFQLPAGAVVNQELLLSWTVKNQGQFDAQGSWTDSVYLSADGQWDLGDLLLGQVARSGGLVAGDTYTTLPQRFTLPPLKAGAYRVIVRPDIFNQVYEGSDEGNNAAASAGTLAVTVPELQMGVARNVVLQNGIGQLYRVQAAAGQTLRFSLDSDSASAANEIYVAFNKVPSASDFDASFTTPLQPDQTAILPTSQAGDYYVLVRALSGAGGGLPARVKAEALPFQIIDVTPDQGGDGRWVSMTISGAQFKTGAVAKLVRPGIAEIAPTRVQVVDATTIQAVFDLRNQPHGLYDVQVTNPDGAVAVLPYRYLVERALPIDVTLGLGGPRALSPGESGLYHVTLESATNVDTPYVFFEMGLPEMGDNGRVLGLPYVSFASNVRGGPSEADNPNSAWASLDSEVNTDGYNLAPGYVLDLAAGGFVGLNFTAQTYPGFKAILAKDKLQLRQVLAEARPEWIADGSFESRMVGYENFIQKLIDNPLAGLKARDHVLRGLGLVVLVQRHERLAVDAVGAQQLAGVARVLAGDGVGQRQQVQGAQRDVGQVADGRGHHVQAAGRIMLRASGGARGVQGGQEAGLAQRGSGWWHRRAW
ncbi:MAG: hypothetical protein J0L74_05970, partial [Burkholderiales bacterium]|nr:hypothetical protein [Burkholderiales bacterium]